MKYTFFAFLTLIGCGASLFTYAQRSIEIREQNSTYSEKAVPVHNGSIDEELVSRYGNILSKHEVGAGGLTAWVVEKNGAQVTLYTTPNVGVIINGIVWDGKTGKNISDKYLPRNYAKSPATGDPYDAPQAPAISKMYDGQVPASINTLNDLAGFKEGNLDAVNTVYVIIDPRCPYCRSAYKKTRKAIKSGFSIKWIPAAVLGQPELGIPLAASLLTSKGSPDVVEKILLHSEQIKTQPTKEMLASLELNLQFFWAAFAKNPEAGEPGVPVAFYVDHRTGQARMLKGFAEGVILDEIFGIGNHD